jgi:hypothetical protein
MPRLMIVGRMLGGVVLGALCGCSLLIDTSEFRTGFPAELRIDGIEPVRLPEGVMEPVIVRGQGLTRQVIVTAVVVWPGGEEPVPIADRLESPDGTELGLLLDLPVLAGYGPEDRNGFVRIDLRKGDIQAGGELEIDGLPELALEAGMPLGDAEVAQRYSEINVLAPTSLVSLEPARLVATRAIRINADLDATGMDATGETGGGAGPGGCSGGNGGAASQDGMPGGCDLGGGQPGTAATGSGGPGGGGGGGGCAVDGVAGGDTGGGGGDSGGIGGAGGDAVCSLDLVPLGKPSNRGHGGGGGGSFDDNVGGGGGGGGGVVELDAPLVVLNAVIRANGGNGAPGASSQCDQPTYGGGGGGGSGGVVVVRADTLVVTDSDRIAVGAGMGAETCPGGPTGGDGAAGRVRIDLATLQSSVVDNLEEVADFFSRNVSQGPRLSASTPRLALSGQKVPIRVRGDAAKTYTVQVDRDQAVEIAGEQTMELALERGFRQVCALVQGVDPELSESKHCLTIAVLGP